MASMSQAVITMLPGQREAFAQHYFAHRNASDALRATYHVTATTSSKTVAERASRILNSLDVQTRLTELQAQADAKNPAVFDAAAALDAWLQIAQANPDELIGLRVGCCRYCHGEGFGYQWKEREYLEALAQVERNTLADSKGALAGLYPYPDIAGGFGFRKAKPPRPDCPECEGEGVERVVARDTSKLSPGARALFGGVKAKKDGLEVIIADRMKALENATRMIGGFNDKLRVDGSLAAMIAVVRELPKDPQEAGRAYQRLISANAA